MGWVLQYIVYTEDDGARVINISNYKRWDPEGKNVFHYVVYGCI